MMQGMPYVQYLFHAVAVGCMLYALTLIEDTAQASSATALATERACHQHPLDNIRSED